MLSGRNRKVATRVLGSMMLAGMTLQAGCAPPSRSVVPQSLAADVKLEHPSMVRFWADEDTGAIRDLIRRQYAQVGTAAEHGVPGVSMRSADFLAISGGGGDGAFAAGLLKGWTKRGDRPVFEVVTGVSAGALAAPFAFLGPDYDARLEEAFTAYSDGDFYRLAIPWGLFGSALTDTTPLRRMIEQRLDDGVLSAIATEYKKGRRLLIQTTNIDAQRPVIWDVSAIAAGDSAAKRRMITEILLASAAIPALFPPVRVAVEADGQRFEELHVDGGVSSQVFFAPPQIRFHTFEKEAFGQARKRRLWVIRNGKLSPEYAASEDGTLALATRAIGILVKNQSLADIRRLERFTSAAGDRFFYSAIPRGFHHQRQSEFDTVYMKALFAEGYRVGLAGAFRSKAPPTLAASD